MTRTGACHHPRHWSDHFGDGGGRPGCHHVPSGRQFAACLGLTPRPHSSGGEEKLDGISKQVDGYLRRLLVAVMRMARKDAAAQPWATQLLTRKPVKIATGALAIKTARIVEAVMTRNAAYAAAAA